MTRFVFAGALIAAIGTVLPCRSVAADSCAQPNAPATVIRAAEPATPPMAQQQHIYGVVHVRVALDDDSKVTSARVWDSPSAILNQAALAAAKASTYQTEVRDCKPVASTYLFTVTFFDPNAPRRER